jgi:hypothetical protein
VSIYDLCPTWPCGLWLTISQRPWSRILGIMIEKTTGASELYVIMIIHPAIDTVPLKHYLRVMNSHSLRQRQLHQRHAFMHRPML